MVAVANHGRWLAVFLGSVLGPVLFLIYVNHITDGVLSSFKAFADDNKL